VPYAHGINVLSVIGARPTPSADLTGSAPEASFLLYVSEDSRWEYRVEEFNWIFAAERADSTGVDIINTSLGYTNGFGSSSMNYTPADMDGKTTVIARGAEKAFTKGIFLVASAGNYGSSSWRVIASPADAEHVLAVGATNSAGALAGYSSRGPSADGRVKPDAMSMGQGTFALRSHGARFATSGTSFSAPLIAGFVANIWQEFPDFTNQQLLDFIRKAGDRYDNPDADFGYGFPNYQRLKDLLITSLNSNEEEGFIHAFPNPFNEQLHIQSTGVFKPHALVFMELYDMAGRTVLNGSLTSEEQGHFSYLLETGNVLPGIYILRLHDGAKQKFLRVFKR
jgi:subtilisin family serine protease